MQMQNQCLVTNAGEYITGELKIKDIGCFQESWDIYMGQIPQDGENKQYVALFLFLKLYCDQMVGFFQVFSTVLKRLCPLHPKNTFVLVLAIFFDF